MNTSLVKNIILVAFLIKIAYDKSMSFIRQSIAIILSVCLAIFLKSVFLNATVPVLGIMILLYIVFSKQKRTNTINIFILTSLVLILVVSTGEITSPLFFLLYFLSFGIAFIFDPKLVFVLTAGLIVLFFPSALKTDVSKNLILLFSLILLSPIAFFAGIAYQKNQKINTAKKQIAKKRGKLKTILHSVLIGLFVDLFIGLFLRTVSAQTMSNNDYIIKMEGFNTSSSVAESNDFKINSSVGGLSPITSEGVNYKIKTGFESSTPPLPFSISLSSDIIDFGILTPTNPVIRTVNLAINSPSVYGYSVIVFENQALTTLPPASKILIPDTTCDNGRCDAQNAAEWINTLTYGFGYRCDNITGADCDIGFKGVNFYKHFPNVENNDSLQSTMAGFGSKKKEARISYKVNISGTQAEGIYNNIITFIAVPNF